jgi:hypothetical protein
LYLVYHISAKYLLDSLIVSLMTILELFILLSFIPYNQ